MKCFDDGYLVELTPGLYRRLEISRDSYFKSVVYIVENRYSDTKEYVRIALDDLIKSPYHAVNRVTKTIMEAIPGISYGLIVGLGDYITNDIADIYEYFLGKQTNIMEEK